MQGRSEVNAGYRSENKPTSILFLCLARDCVDTLPVFFSYLKRLCSYGLYCTAIIGENGSSDKTRLLIEEAAGFNIDLLDTTLMAREANRLTRMAKGRQALLEAAEARRITEDYICIADLDNAMTAPPDPLAIRAAIDRLHADATLFAIGATSFPVYYDLLSLRVEGRDYANLNAEIAKVKKRPLSYFKFHQEHIYSNQRLATSASPILCDSSFNGLCIYSASDYRLGSYRANNEAEVCEHVSFNLSIASATGKKMLISPELIIQAPADHIPVGFLRFWFDRVKERMPRLRIGRR